LFIGFIAFRRAQLKLYPNAAHLALAALERAWAGKGDFLLVTQDVDAPVRDERPTYTTHIYSSAI
jgi:NAD-dependent SIR2 family protein deacetylase